MARDIPALGNALGNRLRKGPALKGRDIVPPFQGYFEKMTDTQGVALGWVVSGRWPSPRVNCEIQDTL